MTNLTTTSLTEALHALRQHRQLQIFSKSIRNSPQLVRLSKCILWKPVINNSIIRKIVCKIQHLPQKSLQNPDTMKKCISKSKMTVHQILFWIWYSSIIRKIHSKIFESWSFQSFDTFRYLMHNKLRCWISFIWLFIKFLSLWFIFSLKIL